MVYKEGCDKYVTTHACGLFLTGNNHSIIRLILFIIISGIRTRIKMHRCIITNIGYMYPSSSLSGIRTRIKMRRSRLVTVFSFWPRTPPMIC